MIYSGKAIKVQATDDGIAELCFDLQDDSVNKFNALTLNELKEAIAAIAADTSLKGVIVTSGKPVLSWARTSWNSPRSSVAAKLR